MKKSYYPGLATLMQRKGEGMEKGPKPPLSIFRSGGFGCLYKYFK